MLQNNIVQYDCFYWIHTAIAYMIKSFYFGFKYEE